MGTRYTARVPDTLDLQQRGGLVIHAMTSCLDPLCRPYSFSNIERNPPVLWELAPYQVKYIEALGLLRLMTGDSTNLHVDQNWRERVIRKEFPIGLNVDGRIHAWFGNNYRLEQDPRWLDLARDTIAWVSGVLKHKDDYSYCAELRTDPVTHVATEEMSTGENAVNVVWTLQGLSPSTPPPASRRPST